MLSLNFFIFDVYILDYIIYHLITQRFLLKGYALFGSLRIDINPAHLFFLRTYTVSEFYATVFLLLSIDSYIVASCKSI
jgi:hypothetical protein